MNDEMQDEQPEAPDDYDEFLKAEDNNNEKQERVIRSQRRTNILLFLLLGAMIYANIYQLRQVKLVPFVNNVDDHGQVVVRKLLLASDVPDDDPHKRAFISNYIRNWVIAGRVRSSDKTVTAGGINAALAGAAGPARVKLQTALHEEDVWNRIEVKRQSVEVIMPKWPAYMGGDTWQAEWEEVVTGGGGIEISRQMYAGTFQIAQQDNWVDGRGNSYGIKIVKFSPQAFSK